MPINHICYIILFSILLYFQACRSIQPGHSGFISHDRDVGISYTSTQSPTQPQIFTMVKQACIRSLSCEVIIFIQSFCAHCGQDPLFAAPHSIIPVSSSTLSTKDVRFTTGIYVLRSVSSCHVISFTTVL